MAEGEEEEDKIEGGKEAEGGKETEADTKEEEAEVGEDMTNEVEEEVDGEDMEDFDEEAERESEEEARQQEAEEIKSVEESPAMAVDNFHSSRCPVCGSASKCKGSICFPCKCSSPSAVRKPRCYC